MCADMCEDMCIDIHPDMYVGICIDDCLGMDGCEHALGHQVNLVIVPTNYFERTNAFARRSCGTQYLNSRWLLWLLWLLWHPTF